MYMHWIIIRKRIKQRFGYRCKRCPMRKEEPGDEKADLLYDDDVDQSLAEIWSFTFGIVFSCLRVYRVVL